MANPAQVTAVLNLLASEKLACPDDETRLRYGDYECPHCGEDLDDQLRSFAQRLVEAAEAVASSSHGAALEPMRPDLAAGQHEGVSDRRM